MITVIRAETIRGGVKKSQEACLADGYLVTVTDAPHRGRIRQQLDFLVLEVMFPGIRPLYPSTEAVEAHLNCYLGLDGRDQRGCLNYTDGRSQIDDLVRRYELLGPSTNKGVLLVVDRERGCPTWTPCLQLVDTKITQGRIDFFPYFRSVDLGGEFALDLGALQLLKEQIAVRLGVKEGMLVAVSKGAHVYLGEET